MATHFGQPLLEAHSVRLHTHYLGLGHAATSLVFQRLGEAIERNGAAHSAVMGILEGLESQQQHRRGSVPS